VGFRQDSSNLPYQFPGGDSLPEIAQAGPARDAMKIGKYTDRRESQKFTPAPLATPDARTTDCEPPGLQGDWRVDRWRPERAISSFRTGLAESGPSDRRRG